MQINDKFLVAIILAVIAAILAFSEALTSVDHLYDDFGQRLSFSLAPDNIVIVAIDDPSLDALGSWPWSKRFHTELVQVLSKEHVKVIGFDVDFSTPEIDASEIDKAFADVNKRAGNVVLPMLLQVSNTGGVVNKNLPIAILAAEAADLGRVNVLLDDDNRVRGFSLWEGVSDNGVSAVGLPSFAQSVLHVANLLPKKLNITQPVIKLAEPLPVNERGNLQQRLVSCSPRHVNFFGPPGHFKQISYMDVLAGKYPPGFFKNKIVLVGATALNLGAFFSTPVSTTMQPMPSVEFHANVIANMQQSTMVQVASNWIVVPFCVLLAIMPILWLPKFTHWKSQLFTAIFFVAVIVSSLFFQHYFYVWLPVSAALVAVLLSYPIWNWRMLVSAQKRLDKELQRLRDELTALGLVSNEALSRVDENTLQSRILKVKLTAEHLRDLHKSRNDTLAFISHDIRAPLGAAMMMLDKFEPNKYSERMNKMLTRAHSMAEGFLQASRAEMINVNRFHVLDIVSLVQQAVDDVYELSVAKQVKVVTSFPDDCVWVKGDFGLLLRAISNLLLNATKYSPEQGVVYVTLENDGQAIELKVVDQGPGIPSKKITKIFKRFSRAEGEHQAQEGSGLGLYFVNVTIKKHRGSVTVQSEEGSGATFVITLPVERRKNDNPIDHDRRMKQLASFYDTI